MDVGMTEHGRRGHATEQRERSGRREQNKAENRTALLKAARAVFAEMGYGAASVRDIVRRTDLASGTFYNYFKDKDEIFEAVVGELTGELLRRHREGPRPGHDGGRVLPPPLRGLFRVRRRGCRAAGAGAQELHRHPHLVRQARRARARPGAERGHPRRAGPGHPAQCRRGLPRRRDGGHRLRDLDGHGRARPGRPRRRHRIRHPPDDGRPRQSAQDVDSLLPERRG